MHDSARIIGVPTDYGQGRRGVDMGPSAVRYAGLSDALERAEVTCVDGGDISAPQPEEVDPSEHPPERGRAKFLGEVRGVATALADRVADALVEGATPLVLGGDHSISIGSMVATGRGVDVGVIWFDAHGDFNTPETSPSGNVHGMPLAAALGLGSFEGREWCTVSGLAAENVALVGLRDLDSGERAAIRESPVSAFTMSDIDERGITSVVDDALAVASDGTEGVHVSLDLDWLDPTVAPGVGTPVRGGVSYREAHTALESVADSGVLRSMDVVEVNPILDMHNETAELAVELTASAFGKRIL